MDGHEREGGDSDALTRQFELWVNVVSCSLVFGWVGQPMESKQCSVRGGVETILHWMAQKGIGI